jgi:hypothetical protein
VAKIVEEPNGRRRRTYPRWATPFEIFGQIADPESYLKPGVSMESLQQMAQQQTDTEAAIDMQQAKRKLLAEVKRRSA